MTENTHPRPILIYRRVESVPFDGEEQAKGEEKSNRDNPVFRNRRNSLATKEKTFSNRNKNTTSASPHLRLLPQVHKLRVTSHSRRFGSRATDRGSRITGYRSQVTPQASGHRSLPISIQVSLLTCRSR